MSDAAISFRPGQIEDAAVLAELVNYAGEGLPLYLWGKMAAPGETAEEVGRKRAARDTGSFSYRNATMIECNGRAVGTLIGYEIPNASEPIPDDLPAMFVPLQDLENLAPGTWYVNVLAVVPEQRGRGLGTKLLRLADETGRKLGKRGMSVIVSDANVGARRLYERQGYREVARRAMVKDGWINDGTDGCCSQSDSDRDLLRHRSCRLAFPANTWKDVRTTALERERVTIDWTGAIDCDVHPRVPDIGALRRYMDSHWSETVQIRGITAFETIAYPRNAPMTTRPDWASDRADEDVGRTSKALLDRHGFGHAILNCLYAVQMIRDEHMAAAFAQAVNDWVRHEWLDRDPRLRASIVVPYQSIDRAVAEIERCAGDPRFVQALFIAGTEEPLGKSRFWPIYAACERHGLTVGIHAGSSYHHAVTGSGWPSYWAEDYAAAAGAMHAQVGSLVAEGVFLKFPKIKAVLIESGVTWLAPYLWRLSKFWRGVRLEVPWIDRLPSEIVKDHIRLTTAPFDAPDGDPEMLARIIDQLPSEDMLLFASDFPHWQHDGDAMLPNGLDPALCRKIMIDNPLATYPRLGGRHAA